MNDLLDDLKQWEAALEFAISELERANDERDRQIFEQSYKAHTELMRRHEIYKTPLVGK